MANPTTRAEFKEYCLSNKYTKWYFNLIDSVSKRNLEEGQYYEKHHYIPKSLGGSDEHIVYLTAREHFIAHALLIKMLSGERKAKMVWALMCMKGKEKRYVNSKIYESAKKHISHSLESRIKMSETRKSEKTFAGEKNPMWGKRGLDSPLYGKKQSKDHKEKRLSQIRGRKHSEESKIKMSMNRKKGPSGKKWFNNGIIETFDLPENKPDNFYFGRLKRRV